MDEHDFWQLIALLDGRAEEPGLSRLSTALAATSPERITGFADRLAEVLHALDTPGHFGQEVRDLEDPPDAPTMPLSEDTFLYLRCAVVAAGRRAYGIVLADPDRLAGAWQMDGESLLYVAEEAWERATGRPWEHETPISYETGHNQAAWAGWRGRGRTG